MGLFVNLPENPGIPYFCAPAFSGFYQKIKIQIPMRLPLLITTLLLFLLQNTLTAQLVWTEPAFPTPSEPVTVFFDATQGTGGLANCSCDVYVHTGLITSLSTSNSDWKHVFTSWGQTNPDWKMDPVPGQPNVYSYDITPSIKERYNVTSPTETIEKMAFVFRNGNGSLEGKDVGGTDIFIDVYPDNLTFSASIVSPSAPSVFTGIGQQIAFEGAASTSATLTLFDNGNQLTTATGTSLSYTINVSTGGTHLVEFKADNGTEVITRSFTYVVPGNTVVQPLPAGAERGITDLGSGNVRFVLEAPGKQHVFLIGDFNNWQFSTDYQLKKTQDGRFWWIEIGGLTPGQYYAFQYLVDGEIRTGDPYSELILDPGNDPWIPAVVWPNMPPYPTGKTTGIVSLLRPGTPAYPWQIQNFDRPEQTELVVYELLLRDFLYQDYNGLTSMLDYFEELGVNAIELMPVNEFSANNSWGYNPTYHYALDKYYGTPDAFRGFVDACHQRGIAVIVDVVFNHAHELNPLCMLYWDEQNFKPAANNPWLNTDPTHDFNVFFDFNHESDGTQEYVKKTLRHWLEAYKVDGFRFDLSKGFTQKVTIGNTGAWGQYDANRIAVIKEYADAIWATSPGAYAILEHFAENSEEKELIEYGCMSWAGAGVHHEYLEAAMGYSSNLWGVTHSSRGWNVPHLVSYMESHDEERMMYKNSQWGNGNGSYQVKDLETGLDRVELASTFFYTVPGPKMLWQFGELGYDFSINHCENGSNNPDCRTSPKPIRWDYVDDPDRVDVYNVVRSLLHLRNNYEVFHTTDFNMDVGLYEKTIHLNSPSMNVAILGNFDVVGQSINPKFQHTGTWYEYFSGETLNVTDTNAELNFQPGEYRLYTDQQVAPPVYFTDDTEVEAVQLDWTLAPNPAVADVSVYFSLKKKAEAELLLLDLQGRQVAAPMVAQYLATGRQQVALPVLAPGMYLVRLSIDGVSETRKLVVVE